MEEKDALSTAPWTLLPVPGNELSIAVSYCIDSGTCRKEAEAFLDLGLCHLGLMVLKVLTMQYQVMYMACVPGLLPCITDSLGTAIPP